MVSSVRNQNLALSIDGQIPRVIELTVFGSFLTKFEEERAVKSEDLDAMVVLIGHYNHQHSKITQLVYELTNYS
jgi:hypothetical protein